MKEVEPRVLTMELDLKRYRHFIMLLHKCSTEKNQAKSLEIELIRKFFASYEMKDPFNNVEIDSCIEQMVIENKVMRSDNTVFFI